MTSSTQPFRNALAIFGALTATCAIPLTILTHELDLHNVPWMLIFHALCLLATIPLFFRKNLGSQMLTRALWWQTLLFGVLLLASERGAGFAIACFMSMGALMALVGAGRIGPTEEDEDSPFHPIAFRTPLMIALVLAIADTVTLFLYAGVGLERFSINSPLLTVAGIAMLVGLHGMYRLKLWGVALNLVTNLVVAGLILHGVFEIPAPLNAGLIATALIQLFLPIPMLGKIIENVCNDGVQKAAEAVSPLGEVAEVVQESRVAVEAVVEVAPASR